MAERTGWVRLSSGVDIAVSDETVFSQEEDRVKSVEYSNQNALNNILQAGVVKGTTSAENGQPSLSLRKKSNFSQTYTDYARSGKKPMPGINSVNVIALNNYGSLRSAQVSISVHDVEQLSEIESLYMRPGYYVLLEWGHAPYAYRADSGGRSSIEFRNTPSTVQNFFETSDRQEIKDNIIRLKKESQGNYDGVLGIIKNFQYSFRSDGGFDCLVDIVSEGEVLEGLKFILNGSLPKENNVVEDGEGDKSLNQAEGEDSSFISPYHSLFNQFRSYINSPLIIDPVISQAAKIRGVATNFAALSSSPFNVENSNISPKYGSLFNTYKKMVKDQFTVDVDDPLFESTFSKTVYINRGNSATFDFSAVTLYVSLGHILYLINNLSIPKIVGTSNGDEQDPVFKFKIDALDTYLSYKGNVSSNSDITMSWSEISEITRLFPDSVAKSPLGDIEAIFSSLDLVTDESVARGGVRSSGSVRDKRTRSFSSSLEIAQQLEKKFFSLNNEKIITEDILINVDYFLSMVENVKFSESDNPYLYDLLINLLDKVSFCLGNTCKLSIEYLDDETNMRIVDRMQVPSERQSIPEIKVTGLGSTVTNLQINSSISSETVNMIAIGASAGAVDLGEDVRSLINFNFGLKSRFSEQIKYFYGQSEKAKTYLDGITRLIDSYEKLLLGQKPNYGSNLSYVFTSIATAIKSQEVNVSPGLIPIEVSITMDGIGGIIIGQAFRLPNNILPNLYRNRIGFIVNGVDHNISENRWETKFTGIMFPLPD